MTETVAGVEIPETPAVVEATSLMQRSTSPLIFHHSRRVFVFGSLMARQLELAPDPELLYVSALFHDAGLAMSASDVVCTAIALHTAPGIPIRMGPEVAATAHGVLTDVAGVGLDKFDDTQVAEITAAH